MMDAWQRENYEKTLSESYKDGYNKAIEYCKKLISERIKRKCNYNSCDDCGECCEIEALLYIENQLN